MLKDNLGKVVKKKLSFASSEGYARPESATRVERGIPTLKKGIYRKLSPMMKERFEFYGRWVHASHGSWLDVNDMELLWSESIDEEKHELICRIKWQILSLRDAWLDHAYSLFRDDRISVFAGSDNGNECIVLLWLELEDEPELWVYDSNGEARYKDLNDYLVSYLTDDLSAFDTSWRL